MGQLPVDAGGISNQAEQLQERRDEWVIKIHNDNHLIARISSIQHCFIGWIARGILDQAVTVCI